MPNQRSVQPRPGQSPFGSSLLRCEPGRPKFRQLVPTRALVRTDGSAEEGLNDRALSNRLVEERERETINAKRFHALDSSATGVVLRLGSLRKWARAPNA